MQIDVTEPLAPRQFCLYYNTDAARISFQRGPAFSRRRRPGIVGFRRRGLPGGPRGRRPTGCRLVRGELSLDVGRLVSELLPAAGCGKDMVTVSLDDQDPYFASPSVSLGQDSPRCHRSSGRTAGLKYRGADSVATSSPAHSGGPDIVSRRRHLALL